MKLSGTPRRLELVPETDEDREVCQEILDGKAVIYYGDRDGQGAALIINTVRESVVQDLIAASTEVRS